MAPSLQIPPGKNWMFWWELLVIGAAFVAWVVILNKPARIS